MELFNLSNLAPIVPEIFLAVSVLGFLVFGVCGGNKTTPLITYGVILVLVAAAALILGDGRTLSGFNGMIVLNPYIAVVKLLILLGAALVLIISSEWLSRADHGIFEYPVLILLSILGMLVLVSSGSLLTIYMGIELMSLPLYVLASVQRDSLRSTEAGLKYFVLGSLASGMLLFGISMIYGFTGTLNLQSLSVIFAETAAMTEPTQPMMISAGLLVGLLLVVVGFSFKVSAVPFHMWTPDVYEGSPTPVTAFFAVAPKVAALAIFARVLMQSFGDLQAYWQQVIVFISIATMAVGALGAITQTSIKRLLAYSSIGHVGYALIGIAAGTEDGASALLIYLGLYIFMSVGAFACVLLMRRKGEYVEQISELSGLAQTRPMMAAAMAIFMFSMAGIPPMAGFFGKFYIFAAAVNSGLYGLAVIGVALSVIAAYYYLKVIKVMYFDEARTPFDKDMSGGMRLVLGGCSAFTLLFFLYPTPIITYAKEAARALSLS
jgi:NADH-quinone oxidoreductase subunit N